MVRRLHFRLSPTFRLWLAVGWLGIVIVDAPAQQRCRDLGLEIGVLPPGRWNAITDVAGVRVGHATLIDGDSVRTGVTAILPHGGNVFQEKVPAAIFVGNGFGKLTGITQVRELGNLETPIVLTNTLSVPAAMEGVIDYVLGLPGNEQVRSVNAVVGETNDGRLNDIRARHVNPRHVRQAIASAASGEVAEGSVGAGTGTVCFGFKGGIGTSSRVVADPDGGYVVGVLVQSNFGGILRVNGAVVGPSLQRAISDNGRADTADPPDADGSCIIVVATDAPLEPRNLQRLAARAMLGLARTGGVAANGSGDYVIAFSTDPRARVAHVGSGRTDQSVTLRNEAMSPLFLAVVEATEEAILNSLLMAESMSGYRGRQVDAIPVKGLLRLLREFRVISDQR